MANTVTSPVYVQAKPNVGAEKQVGTSDLSGRTDVINRPVKGVWAVLQRVLNTLFDTATVDATDLTTLTALSTFVAKFGASLGTVRGVIGARASTTTYTFSAADMIAFYNPTTKSIEKIKTAQGSLTNTITTAGPAANGRDQAGAFSANSWAYFYYIYNPTTDTTATVSSPLAPPTGPVLPSGYTSWALITPLRLNASIQFGYATRIVGNRVFVDLNADATMLSGGAATSYTVINTSAFVPPPAVCPEFEMGIHFIQLSVGAGAISGNAAFSYDGTNEAKGIGFGDVAAAGSEARRIITQVPNVANVANTIYYKHTVANTTASSSDVYLTSYRVANGG